jgi:hypothetical protein
VARTREREIPARMPPFKFRAFKWSSNTLNRIANHRGFGITRNCAYTDASRTRKLVYGLLHRLKTDPGKAKKSLLPKQPAVSCKPVTNAHGAARIAGLALQAARPADRWFWTPKQPTQLPTSKTSEEGIAAVPVARRRRGSSSSYGGSSPRAPSTGRCTCC